jgi:hypothetical protein
MAETDLITTPAGSTIRPVLEGGYHVCDRYQRCRRVWSLWEAQELVHWAELHHRPLDNPTTPRKPVTTATAAAP